MRTSCSHSEQGAALVLVLVFLTATGLVVSALLFGTSTAEKTTVVTAELANAYYAADSGVEYGVSKLRAMNGLCPPGGIYSDLPAAMADGQSLTVTCGGGDSDEASASATSWAVVTFSPNAGSLTNNLATNVEKQISGRTYVRGGFDLGSLTRVNSEPPDSQAAADFDGLGVVLQHKPPCISATASKPARLITPNFNCTELTLDDIDPKPPLPALPTARPRGPVTSVLKDAATGFTCGIFLPGTYSDASSPGSPPNPLGLLTGANTANYFASGVYYFDGLGEIDFKDYTVFAGEDASEKKALSKLPCATDAEASAAAAAAGVPGLTSGDRGAQFIVGGNSWLDFDKSDTEVLGYNPSNGSSIGGRGVSIRSVPDNTPSSTGYTSSVADGFSNGVGMHVSVGNNPHFAVHGLVYMPNARVELNSTNKAAAQVLGGVMAWELELNASASGSGLIVQTSGERPRSRSKVVIEATVPVSGTKDVKARAVVDVHVDPPLRIAPGATYDGTASTPATTATAASATFTQSDVGSYILGGTIPRRTYIKTVSASGDAVTMSQPATLAENPVELTIDPSTRSRMGGYATVGGVTTVTIPASTPVKFSQDDVGAAIASVAPAKTGTLEAGEPDYGDIPAGTKILSLISPTQVVISPPGLSQPPIGDKASALLSVTRRRITTSIVSWRVDNP